MYEHYFRLTRPPFSLALEPDFLYPTSEHKEALAALAYAISSQKGFVLLTGEVGTGKSTVIRSVLRTLIDSHGERFRFCLVVNPNLSADDLLEFVLSNLGAHDLPSGKSQRLMRFQQLLIQARKAGQICALIIDEAQRLSPDLLEEIRLWTNFETSESKLLQIVLAGQTEFEELLNQPQLRQLKQRIAYRARFSPLTPEEVQSYISHRWSKAGGELPAPFTSHAIEAVTFWSKGLPRLINSICDNALLTAFALETRVVTAMEVNEAATDLDLKSSGIAPREPEQIISEAIISVPTAEAPPVNEEKIEPKAISATTATTSATTPNGHAPAFEVVDTDSVLKRWVSRLGLGKSK